MEVDTRDRFPFYLSNLQVWDSSVFIFFFRTVLLFIQLLASQYKLFPPPPPLSLSIALERTTDALIVF